MYKLYVRPIGSNAVPDGRSSETLNDAIYNTQDVARVIYDPVMSTISQYVESPHVKLSIEDSGECTFIVKKGHPFYSKITPYASEILLYDDMECMWVGRVINAEVNKKYEKNVTAEGVKSGLNDIFVMGKNASGKVPHSDAEWSLYDVLDEYVIPAFGQNGTVPKKNKIQRYSVAESDIAIPRKSLDGTVAFDDGFEYLSVYELLDQILGDYGGFFMLFPNIIDDVYTNSLVYYRDYPKIGDTYYAGNNKHVIQQFIANTNSNIEELTISYDIDSLCTAVLPLGAKILPSTYPINPHASYAANVERINIDKNSDTTSSRKRYIGASVDSITVQYNRYLAAQKEYEDAKKEYEDTPSHEVQAHNDAAIRLTNAKQGLAYFESSSSPGTYPIISEYNEIKTEESALDAEISKIDDTITSITSSTSFRQMGVYLYSPTAVNKFGWIEKKVSYDDISDMNELAKQAAIDLALILVQNTTTALTFSTMTSDNNMALPHLLDRVMVVAPDFGISLTESLPIVELDIDLNKPWESKVSLSKTNSALITKMFK